MESRRSAIVRLAKHPASHTEPLRVGARPTRSTPPATMLVHPKPSPPSRPSVVRGSRRVTLFPFFHGAFARGVSFMLTPLLFLYPLVPLYADEGGETSAPPPASVESAPPAPTPDASASAPASEVVEAVTVDTPAAPDPATDAPVEDAPPLEAPPSGDPTPEMLDESGDVSQEDVSIPDSSEGEVLGESDTGEEDPAPLSEEEAQSSEGDDTPLPSDSETTSASSTANTSGGSESPVGEANEESGTPAPEEGEEMGSTTPSLAEEDSSQELASSTDRFASSTDEATVEEVVDEPPPVEAPEVIVARLLAEREAVLRNTLRQEIESQYTKGCIDMDGVGYYCLKETAPSSELSSVPPVSRVDVESVPGSAYKQVVMTKGDTSTPITTDAWDSAFASTDLSGRSIVWQGNVSGRWQIFFADASGTSTPEIVRVTDSRESNFNPRVEGSTIVWQAWVDGNWEIYLATRYAPADRPSDDNPIPEENARLGITHEWNVERITANDDHDMFPSISGGLVTWQAFQNGTWNVMVYSMTTKTVAKISRDGVKSENPRFAVTWDERLADGTVRMMGYDIATGEVVDLTGAARESADRTNPYAPEAPITQTNQAALPSTSTGTASSSPARGDGDDTSDNELEV